MSEKLDVFFLGTGGGVPSSRRYLPAVALRRGGEWFLFDAGEGVQMRLRQSPLGWGGLQAVFISHLHGDHVLGLPGLLMSMGMARIQTPLGVYGPPGLAPLLETILRTCRVQLPFSLDVHPIPAAGGIIYQGDGLHVAAAPLRHRIACWGFVLREDPRPGRFYPERARELEIPSGPLFKELQQGREVTLPDGRTIQPEQVLGPPRPGRTIAYCTDTGPVEGLASVICRADLLIHDCTFGDGFEEEARISGHSTAAQAAALAREAGCHRLALTHVSARYEDETPLEAEARVLFSNSFVAADLMRVEIPVREE